MDWRRFQTKGCFYLLQLLLMSRVRLLTLYNDAVIGHNIIVSMQRFSIDTISKFDDKPN